MASKPSEEKGSSCSKVKASTKVIGSRNAYEKSWTGITPFNQVSQYHNHPVYVHWVVCNMLSSEGVTSFVPCLEDAVGRLEKRPPPFHLADSVSLLWIADVICQRSLL